MSAAPPEETRASDLRAYIIGFVLAVILTVLSFGLALTQLPGTVGTYIGIAVLAIVQIIVHLRFFLHIDLSRQKREDLQLILFAVLIIVIVVGGTLWILGNLMHRMG